jgi:hypothetical protein
MCFLLPGTKSIINTASNDEETEISLFFDKIFMKKMNQL